MNLRRYLPVAVLVIAIGVIVYLVLFGAQRTVAPPSGGLTVPGNSVTIAAVDQAGRYGSITLTRRGERGLRADERLQAAETDGAITVVEVHVAYLPERATGTGFGFLDGQVWVDGTLQDGGAPVLFPTLLFRGPGSLPTQFRGNAEIGGIVAVPIPPAAVGKAVYLVYASAIEPVDGGFDYKVVARAQVWEP